MRAIAYITLVPAVALVAVPRPVSAAYNLPWCAQLYTPWYVRSCAYNTYEQCLATIRGVGGVCIGNPNYSPAQLSVQPQRRKPHRDATVRSTRPSAPVPGE
jgi:hypothetical protein